MQLLVDTEACMGALKNISHSKFPHDPVILTCFFYQRRKPNFELEICTDNSIKMNEDIITQCSIICLLPAFFNLRVLFLNSFRYGRFR
jgi:hypothetical protein